MWDLIKGFFFSETKYYKHTLMDRRLLTSGCVLYWYDTTMKLETSMYPHLNFIHTVTECSKEEYVNGI